MDGTPTAPPLDTVRIVTTVDLGQRPGQLLGRLQAMASVLAAQGWTLVVAHNDRNSAADIKLKRWSESRIDPHRIQLVSGRFFDGPVNNALLRNRAFEALDSRCDTIILMDVDLCPDHALLMHLLRQSQSGHPIAMVPVLYLNAIGTLGMKRRLSADLLIHDFMSMRRRWTLHLALPSSFIAFRRSHLADCGLFDETYTGHGYEDFDFMIRLGLSSGVLKPNQDLLMDEKTSAPLLARGFRSCLGQIGLQSLLDRRIGLHSFHARSDMHAHRQAQADNRDRFQHRMAALQRTWPPTDPDRADRADPVPPILRTFYLLCHEQGRSPHDLDACLDARPGHLIRSGWRTRLLNHIAGAWSC
ncbi:MAG: hypothetical protein RL489_2857 [Pseudomonadota bacterium]|jgi:predicted glycosyltransferase involved in capsule biosynthesis